MWLFTDFGFLSVVQKYGTDFLTVRSRCEQDLINFKKYAPEASDIVINGGTDYKYRCTLTHDEFAKAMTEIVKHLTYDNFKSRVAKTQGWNRADVYHKIWDVVWKTED